MINNFEQYSLSFIDVVKLLADASETIVVITDAQLDAPGPRILYANPAYEDMTGYKPAEVIGKNPRFLQGDRTNKALARRFARTLQKGEHARTTIVNYRKCGEPYNCDIAAWPVTNKKDEIEYFIAFERELARVPGRRDTARTEQPWWIEGLVPSTVQ